MKKREATPLFHMITTALFTILGCLLLLAFVICFIIHLANLQILLPYIPSLSISLLLLVGCVVSFSIALMFSIGFFAYIDEIRAG